MGDVVVSIKCTVCFLVYHSEKTCYNTRMTKKIFAIILNYNGRDTLVDCLKSVFASDCAELEIVVVDNASKDGSFESAKTLFPRAHFISSPKNIGFSSGNNLGIRFALEKGADAIFLLNNDAFVERETIALLRDEAQRMGKPAILSPLIYAGTLGDKKKIWFQSGRIDWNRMRTTHDQNTVKNMKQPYPTEYITGCSMFIPKEVFKKIGLFDEMFFLYYEDADFSLRARRAGFPVMVYPEARAYHLEKSSSDPLSKLYWLVVSGILFFQKNARGFMRFRIYCRLVARKCKNALDRKKHPDDQVAQIVHKAYQDVQSTKSFRHHR